MKKKLFFVLLCTSSHLFAQSITIIPTSPASAKALEIKKVGIGFDHRSSDGLIGIGTYISASEGYIQTHTNHSLAFATNDGGLQMILKTNGNFGIGTDNPQYLLDVTQRARIRTGVTTAGIWFSKSNNNVEEGAFFGNLDDTHTGIFIGNNWRFSISDAGVVKVPNLIGTGTRSIGADANGNLVVVPTGNANTVGFSIGIPFNTYALTPANGSPIFLGGDIEYNIGNAWNSTTFTAPTTGLYNFTVKLSWEGNANGARLIFLTKNNATDIKGTFAIPGNNLPFSQHFNTTVYLNANDTIKLKVYQTSGVDLDVRGELYDSTIFSGYKIN
jgi:hypothetical protein